MRILKFAAPAFAALALISAPGGLDAKPKDCPPGLAKKDNGCQPPGQAKKDDGYGDRTREVYRERHRDLSDDEMIGETHRHQRYDGTFYTHTHNTTGRHSHLDDGQVYGFRHSHERADGSSYTHSHDNDGRHAHSGEGRIPTYRYGVGDRIGEDDFVILRDYDRYGLRAPLDDQYYVRVDDEVYLAARNTLSIIEVIQLLSQ